MRTLFRFSTLLACAFLLFGYAPPPPANDDCANALPIVISGGGFDYGIFTSAVSDLTMATGQTGEHFDFSGHSKSVWYEFSLPTHRNFKLRLVAASGSSISGVSLTLYQPVGCLPSKSNLISAQSGNDGGTVQNNSCGFGYGTYKIQISSAANLDASVFVEITMACPSAADSKYDCPANAYLFNAGNPLPQGSTSSDNHTIGCQSLDAANESTCLPLPNPADYLQSTWYVFKTGTPIDLLSLRFGVSPSGEKVGYRIFQGDVRPAGPAPLTELACGLAKEDFSTRYIEFPCLLQPNTTYSIALFFHKNFTNNGNALSLTLRQRGVAAAGWPRPVLPPVLATNQLGTLPGGGANGTTTPWLDRFDCSAFISKNPCPPANPTSGKVVLGTGSSAKTFDLATWATFTLASDANVEFRFWDWHSTTALHTRIFKKTLTGNCPSPDPATADLYYEFSGANGYAGCMPAGDYSVQVLSSSVYPLPTTSGYWDAWNYANLGTDFELRFTVMSLTDPGLFRLDATSKFDPVNQLNALQNNVLYPSTPAVFVCANTVLPDSSKCAGMTKAMYREVRIGDADGNALPDSGLLCMSGLRTDFWADPPHVYAFFKGDADQLATAAGTHVFGQKIPGLIDWAGFCIDDDDYAGSIAGIDNFCACVTPGIYTLASLGDADNVGRGDAPGFRFGTQKTLHDSRANAEVIAIGAVPGTYTSAPDVFSCKDNLGSMPACGTRKKLVFREFFLPEDAVASISETGTSTATFTLCRGRASDAAANLTILAGCANNVPLAQLVNDCAPLPAGWYTLVSYGEGPDYTDKKVWNNIGDPRDVGKTTRISISVRKPDVPNFNRPDKAHIAGLTDWVAAPLANPNATTSRLYNFLTDTFCAPDTPFISNNIASCAADYNRVSFYVFEITKRSFVQIRNVDQSFYTEVFPFDVKAQPASLLSVPPVYQCLSVFKDYRQLCDLPPGKYTIAIFANNSHEGRSVSPVLYVDAIGYSRFDHALNAYDYGHIPKTNAFVNGKTNDVHPVFPTQHPSRDVFYCTTGATATDPAETRCNTQLNPLVYAQPDGVPKPLFLPNNPPSPLAQPWRNLWYTFVLSGSGECTLQPNLLGGGGNRPLVAVYESDVDGNIPWATLRNTLGGVDSTLASGLKFVETNLFGICDGWGDLDFRKNGCLRDSVRYYVVVSFDADYYPNLPNQAVSLSIKYAPSPTFPALYDELATANVVNGLGQTAPPYTTVPLTPGSTFVGPDFSLLCYTKNVTDPVSSLSCYSGTTGKSAWFKFEVANGGQFYAALENMAASNNWVTNERDLTIWQETVPGGPLTQLLAFDETFVSGQHYWQEGCIGPGTYYLLVRHCSYSIDTLPPYRVVLKLTDSPGDFCSNAVPLNVPNFSPTSVAVTPDCHTIGTDFGEASPLGMGCLFGPAGKKTSWLKATVTAGPKMDITFQLAENLSGANLNDLPYRVFFGSCGALTPIVCSAVGSNIITQNCLPPGDYYVQVAMPEKVGSTAVEGTFTLSIAAKPSADAACSPPDLGSPKADFAHSSTCTTVTLINLSTAGTDIAYQWQFPGGSPATSAQANPTWTPPGAGNYTVTLTVTNTALNKSTSVTKPVSVSNPFAAYQPLPDRVICNGSAALTLDATVPGATYLWDNGSTAATRSVSAAGTFWVKIRKDSCEKRDTANVVAVTAKRDIKAKLCPGGNLIVGGEVFDQNKPSGTVTLLKAHPSGCDSLLNVSLSFYSKPTATPLAATICAGDNYIFGNKTLTQSGTYADTLRNPAGCDSLYRSLTLSVTPRQNLQTTASGCTGAQLSLTAQTTGTAYLWDDGQTTTPTRSVNSPGTYTVSVSNAAGCVIGEETFTVSFGALAPPSVVAPAPVCPGSDVPLTASGSSGQYQWFDALSGGTLLGTGASYLLTDLQASLTVFVGAYQPGVTGCVSQRQVVTVTVLPTFSSSFAANICQGDAYIFGGTPLTAPGTYVHTFAAANNGCDSVVMLQLTVTPRQTFAQTASGCTGASLHLAPTLTGAAYTWNTAVNTDTLTTTAPGTYTVSVSDVAGCVIGEETFAVTFGALAPPAVTATSPCSNGAATLTASGSSGEYRWFDVPTGGTALDTGAIFITGLLTVGATYYAEAFQSAVAGCQSQRTAVQVQVWPTFDLSISDTICDGAVRQFGSQMLTKSGNYTEVFPTQHGCDSTVHLRLTVLPPVSQSSAVELCAGKTYTLPNGLKADTSGTYTGTYTDPATGCPGTWEVMLSIAPPVLYGSDTASICFGQAYALPGGVKADTSGTYTGLFLDAAIGCIGQWQVVLTVLPPLSLAATTVQPRCAGSNDGSISAQPSGGSAGFAFSLDGGPFQANPNFTSLAAGQYTLTVRDAQGCTSSTSATLTAPPALVFSVKKSDPRCAGAADGSLEAASASGGTGPLEYSLNGGVFQQSPVFGSLAAGQYTLTVRDAQGCTISTSATLTAPPALVFSVKKSEPRCAGATDGSLEAEAASGGTGPLEYSLNGGVFQQSPVFGSLVAGQYTLTVRDAQGCTTSASATLAAPSALVFSVKKSDPRCSGIADGSLEAEAASGGIGPLEYSLNGGVFQQSPVFGSLVAGQYTLTVRDAQGCTTSASATLAAPPALIFSVKKSEPRCAGATDGSLEAEAASGGTGPLEYSLNGGVFQQSPVFGSLVAGQYTLTVRDAQGCTASVSASLPDPSPIDLTAAASSPTCFGFADGSIAAKTLGGTPPLSFSLNAGSPQPNPVFANLTAGSFQLAAVDGRGCRDSAQVVLSEPPKIALALDASSPLCHSEQPLGSVSATASGGQPPLLYALGVGAFSGAADFKNLPPALYTVTAQDAAGCEMSANVEVEAPPALPLTLPSVLTVQWGDSVLLLPQIGFVADSLAWSPSEGLSCADCPSPWAKPSQSMGYLLTVWSAAGCSVAARVRLEVKRELRIYVPNVFKPDGSGLNDELLVFGGAEVSLVRSLSVYDRWGNALWQATDFAPNSLVGWDGRSRGQQMNPGVYVWMCEIELNDGTREWLAGDVTVVR